MAFWDDPLGNIGRAIGGFFGIGGQQEKKKKDEEEQNSVRPTSSAPKIQNASQPKIQTQRPDNLFQGLNKNLTLPGAPETKLTPTKPQKSSEEQELDRLTQRNLADAKKKVQEGQNFFDKAINFFTHNDDKTAETMARTRAIRQFQDEKGYDKNGLWPRDRCRMCYQRHQ